MAAMRSLLLSLALTLSLLPPSLAKTPGEVEVGAILREVPMRGISVPSRMLSDYRGKPLIINVWASWCGPCREEMPSLQRLARLGGGRFTVIGISTDDYIDRATGFVKVTGTTFDNFIDNRLVLEHMLGAERLPLTLLVDAHGRVLAKHYGAQAWDSPQALATVGKAFGIKL